QTLKNATRNLSLDFSFSCSDGYAHIAPVGQFAPNAFGLYDMHGNAWQWVEDCWHDGGYAGAPSDGSAWTSGDCSGHPIRGGSWRDSPEFLRSAFRFDDDTNMRMDDHGFRVARTLTR